MDGHHEVRVGVDRPAVERQVVLPGEPGVGDVVQAVELDADAELAPPLLEVLADRLVVRVGGVAQHAVADGLAVLADALAVAVLLVTRLVEQPGRLVRVVRQLLVRGRFPVVLREARRDVALALDGVPLEHLFDDGLAVDGHEQRVAHPLVEQGGVAVAELLAVLGLRARVGGEGVEAAAGSVVDLDVVRALQRSRLSGGKGRRPGDERHLALAQRRHRRVLVLVVAEDHLVELRRPAPEPLVGLEPDVAVGLVVGQRERPVPDDGEALVVVELGEVRDLLPHVLRHDRHIERDHRGLRLLQLDDQLGGARGRHLLEVADVTAVGRGRAVVGHHLVERPRRVLGGGLLAVRPLGVRADRVRPGQLVRRRLPLGGQAPDGVVVLGVVVGQVLVHEPVNARTEQPDRQERAERVHALRHRDGQHLAVVGRPGLLGRRVERGGEPGGEGERGRPGHGDEPEAAREAACLIVRAHGRTSRHRSDGKDGLISCQTFDVCVSAAVSTRQRRVHPLWPAEITNWRGFRTHWSRPLTPSWPGAGNGFRP